jgi:N-acetylglucosaminyldiphosphoundecaprenol N-acetyl-beta-D-mannosaminyltransferase
MDQAQHKTLPILGLPISLNGPQEMLNEISEAINGRNRFSFTYANQQVLCAYSTEEGLQSVYASFDVVHSDGTGAAFAGKFLYGNEWITGRMNGTDFYEDLILHIIRNRWRIFFFGNRDEVLREIPARYPDLQIAGTHNGFDYQSDILTREINQSKADILVVGMGAPKQERWIAENAAALNVPVIAAVGEGIAVFAGSKYRGPQWMQSAGLEWLARLLHQPKLFWKRYLMGIPVFMWKVLLQKMDLR